MEQEWDLHGINRQYTVCKFVKFFPDTAYIFNEVAEALPEEIKDGIATYALCCLNLNHHADELEILTSYFGLPYKRYNGSEPEPESKEELEPAQEDEDIEAGLEEGIDKTEDYLKLCRYYHGEEECPDNLEDNQTTFGSMEQAWIKSAKNTDWEDSVIAEFLLDFPDGFKDIDIPLGLKAIISDQYQHWCSGKDGVEDYLISYLRNAPKK